MNRKHGLKAAFSAVFVCGVLTGAAVFSDGAGIRNAWLPYAFAAEEEESEAAEETYLIRYHDDFGEEDAVFTQTASFGEVLLLSDPPWEHEGYVFAGWYADGVGLNHALANAYAPGAAVKDLTETPGDVIELYAGWYGKRE